MIESALTIFGRQRLSWLGGFWLLLFAQLSWAQVACEDVFTNGLQSHSPTGNIHFQGSPVTVTGGTRTLDAPSLSHGGAPGQVRCAGQPCQESGFPAAASTPSFITGSQTDGNITTGFQGSASRPAGDYGTVSLANESVLTFTTTNGTYLTRAFTTNFRARIRFQPGDYWVDGNFNAANETVFERVGPAGTVRLFVNGDVNINWASVFNNFAPGELLIYATGNVTIATRQPVPAFIYAGGHIQTDFQSVINGGLSGATLSIGQESQINYPAAIVGDLDFHPFCGEPEPLDHYTLAHASVALTCEGEPVTVTARDSDGNAIAPPAGTQIIFSTDPATGTWVGGNTYTFGGTETSVTRALQQTTPATLTLEVTDGVASAVPSNITFVDTALQFQGLPALPDSILAGEAYNGASVRAIRTDSDTGACVARVEGSRPVGLAYECNNPDTCVVGESLTIAGAPAAANDQGQVNSYADITLTFDANGVAPLPDIIYSDVGELRLHARLELAASGDDPAITLAGSSAEFVVKPHSILVTSVTNNPATTVPDCNNPAAPASAGFVAAGEAFEVEVQVRNAQGNPTPNYGQEIAPEGITLELAALVYPAGGNSQGSLVDPDLFSESAPGIFINSDVRWLEVGSMQVTASIADGDYLGAGNAANRPTSDTIGRFFPDHYELIAEAVLPTCPDDDFSYMDQPELSLNYTLQANSLSETPVINYDNTDQAQHYACTATVDYQAENDGDGENLGQRLQVQTATWNNGQLEVDDDFALFARQASGEPDGPFPQLQLGVGLIDELDNRPLLGLNMNAEDDGDCLAGNNCTAVTLGDPMAMRYGRLRLDNAFGLETEPLPVRFVTQYWDGSAWQDNGDDNCTRVPRSDIHYPEGSIDDNDNLAVDVSGGTSTGEYAHTDMGVDNDIVFVAGDAGHSFTAPGLDNIGNFNVRINLQNLPWLQYDWSRDGTPDDEIDAIYGFGRYRGQDRVIYWREVLE